MVSKFKITTAGKVVIFLVIIAITLGALFATGTLNPKTLIGKGDSNTTTTTTTTTTTNGVTTVTGNSSDAMDISLDEWIGWKPIMDANGGATTKPGSIYDKLGLKLNIHIINDATQSSNALIKGDIDGAGYTINRYSFLFNKFKENNTPTSMMYITNASTGGDGIIAKKEIKRVEDLAGKKIAVPRFSEAQTLVEWLITHSSLSTAQQDAIRKSEVMFDTPDDAAKACFAGQVDAAATWEPYLSQAAQNGYHVLFSTKVATNIILDGIVFRKDYSDANKDKVAKFIEGALEAEGLYTSNFTAIKDTMPTFSTSSDKDIKDMTTSATLSNFASNKTLFGGIAQQLFTDMSTIWKNLGESADPGNVSSALDGSVLLSLADKFPTVIENKTQFTEEQRTEAKAQDNNEALLKQTATINFKPDSDEFVDKDAAYQVLNNFVNTAKILDNTVIQIEGNTSSDGNNQYNMDLSLKRAQAIATYLKYQGINPSRFVVIGNGPTKPVAKNDTEENRAKNRRTDVFFKVVK